MATSKSLKSYRDEGSSNISDCARCNARSIVSDWHYKIPQDPPLGLTFRVCSPCAASILVTINKHITVI